MQREKNVKIKKGFCQLISFFLNLLKVGFEPTGLKHAFFRSPVSSLSVKTECNQPLCHSSIFYIDKTRGSGIKPSYASYPNLAPDKWFSL